MWEILYRHGKAMLFCFYPGAATNFPTAEEKAPPKSSSISVMLVFPEFGNP